MYAAETAAIRARMIAVTAVLVNVAAHAVLIPSHLSEMPYIGVLFIVGNVVLLAGMLLLARPELRSYGWTVLVLASSTEFAAFFASRTVGLPSGYREGWAASGENSLGWVSLATEVVIVIAAYCAMSLARGVRPAPLARIAGVVGAVAIVTGCAAAVATQESAPMETSHAQASPTSASQPGMPHEDMPNEDMSSHAEMSPTAAPQIPDADKPPARASAASDSAGPKTNAAPTAATQMICGAETKANVAQLLGLRTAPTAVATWKDHVYTCTYRASGGQLVLSVKESADPTAARQYFDALRRRVGATRPLKGLAGLGLPAFESSNGQVMFLKDANTLLVDAAGMPAQSGPARHTRDDLAFTVASSVMACWTGN